MTLDDKELHDMMARSCLAASAEIDGQILHAFARELIELRAYKQQVERVKACGKCEGHGEVRRSRDNSWRECTACGGFPDDND